MADKLLRKKDYPLNYPDDVLNIIQLMAYDKNKVNVVGSMSLKSQQYAGDYDMFEMVNGSYKSELTAVNAFVKQFQDKVRKLMNQRDCFAGDIKAGIIKEWEVIPESSGVLNNKVVGYDATSSRAKIKELLDNKVLTEEEAKYANGLIVESPSTNQFLQLKKELRFHIVRWKPSEVLKGSLKLRDGRTYSLSEAFKSPAIVKLDVVALVQNNRFTDFSIIYLFKNKGKAINDVKLDDEVNALKQDVLYYISVENYFKVAKRLFSLARVKKNNKMIVKLNDMLNGDLGRLYSIISDCGTLLYLLENETNIPIERIKYELDQFRSRLGNIYSINAGTDTILNKLVSVSGFPKNKAGKKKLENTLMTLMNRFESILASESKKEMLRLGVLPLDGF